MRRLFPRPERNNFARLEYAAESDLFSCRHPDKVRPSLEAFGFDLMKTSENLLGIKMVWGMDGMMPEYLTLVCGVFYDRKEDK